MDKATEDLKEAPDVLQTPEEEATFAAALRKYRGLVGFTQEELAMASGLRASTFSAHECGKHGKPQRATYDLLTEALRRRAQEVGVSNQLAQEAQRRLDNAYHRARRGRVAVDQDLPALVPGISGDSGMDRGEVSTPEALLPVVPQKKDAAEQDVNKQDAEQSDGGTLERKQAREREAAVPAPGNTYVEDNSVVNSVVTVITTDRRSTSSDVHAYDRRVYNQMHLYGRSNSSGDQRGRGNRGTRPISRQRLFLWGTVALCSVGVCAFLLAANLGLGASFPHGAHGSGMTNTSGQDAGVTGTQRSPTIDGWFPLAIPYGQVSENRSAIAVRDMRTGTQMVILVPVEGSKYWSYLGPLWSPSRHQLYFIAVTNDGRHDIWYTPLHENGVADPPSVVGPRPLLAGCGPRCTSLGWSRDGQSLTFAGPNGGLMEINPDTAQQREVAFASARALHSTSDDTT